MGQKHLGIGVDIAKVKNLLPLPACIVVGSDSVCVEARHIDCEERSKMAADIYVQSIAGPRFFPFFSPPDYSPLEQPRRFNVFGIPLPNDFGRNKMYET